MIAGNETKVCPMCAMEVPGAAQVCHFCDYSFVYGTTAEQRRELAEASGRQHAAVLAKGSRNIVLIRTLVPLLFLVFVFIMVGLILMASLDRIKQVKPETVPPHSPKTTAVVIDTSSTLTSLMLDG